MIYTTNREDLIKLLNNFRSKSQDEGFRADLIQKIIDFVDDQIKGTQAKQFIKIETEVLVGPTTPGDQPAAISFDEAFPNACDGVFVMFGDQDANALGSGYECGGISITAVTKSGFTCTFRWTAAPGSAGNIYFTIFAIGR